MHVVKEDADKVTGECTDGYSGGNDRDTDTLMFDDFCKKNATRVSSMSRLQFTGRALTDDGRQRATGS